MNKIDALTKTLYGDKFEKVAVIHAAFEEVPNVVGGFDSRTVAFVEVEAALPIRKKLEIAFVKTNTINGAWWRNEGVEYIAPEKTCRSTSVGDMVLVGKDKYVCKDCGWETLDGEVVR
jgi:hypothetical protein